MNSQTLMMLKLGKRTRRHLSKSSCVQLPAFSGRICQRRGHAVEVARVASASAEFHRRELLSEQKMKRGEGVERRGEERKKLPTLSLSRPIFCSVKTSKSPLLNISLLCPPRKRLRLRLLWKRERERYLVLRHSPFL